MASNVLFTFPNDGDREKFFEAVHGLAVKSEDKFVLDVMNRVKRNVAVKTESERAVALYVGGKKICEGLLVEMRRRFNQEVASHSATVELKEHRDGRWAVIQTRKFQRT